MSINEIKKNLSKVEINMIMKELEQYRKDKRKGVQNLIVSYEKKYNNYLQECQRLVEMNNYENFYYEKGFKCIVGIDEVGRGPLAGPILACSVILKPNTKIVGINDSKKLSKEKREYLFDEIKEVALYISIGQVSNQYIDEFNISIANFKAMELSLYNLGIKPDIALIDGLKVPNKFINIEQLAITQGDSKSVSIAAASIVAKVTRDNIMKGYHEEYPFYNFISNSGYGSAEHISAIKKHGICPIHRKSFLKNFDF